MNTECTKCRTLKDKKEFSPSRLSAGYPLCKECASSSRKRYWYGRQKDWSTFINKHIQTKRDFVAKLKEQSPCTDCKSYFPACVMDYDHRIPSLKFKGVAAMIRS